MDYPDPKRPDEPILKLLQICLENNDFTFNNEWFLQTWGTAMGKKFAPNYANIFLAQWEKYALRKCSKIPQCFFRFLDDIFIIWPHTHKEFEDLFDILNNHHPTIKLKSSISKDSIDFLDLTIFKGPQFYEMGQLDTKVYFKPTDTHELLHKKSYHPKHTFKGIIKSQILRFRRNCTNTKAFDSACTTLFQALKHRGYSGRYLRTLKQETLSIHKPTGKSEKCNKPKCKTCPFITETNQVHGNNKNSISFLKETMNCQTQEVVYLIQCKNCQMKYVGQTCMTLNRRFTHHRSDILLDKICPVSTHFNITCPNKEFLSITPLETVPRTCPFTFMSILANEDKLRLLQREQYWIKKLNTMTPIGLNHRNEIPPPIPFIIQFNDQAGHIGKFIKQTYNSIQTKFYGTFRKYQYITAYKRNKNLKDILVSASIKM